MKKTYIQPSIEAVKIQLSNMVMTSGTEQKGTTEITNQNKILSVRNDFGEVELDD